MQCLLDCQLLLCDLRLCSHGVQMVKEQKGRIGELIRSKQESVGQLKVSR